MRTAGLGLFRQAASRDDAQREVPPVLDVWPRMPPKVMNKSNSFPGSAA